MTTPPPPPPPPGTMGDTSKNSFGTWALVLGILSLVCCGLVAGIPAIILGNMSKKAGAEGTATNSNLGNIGFILGIVGTALTTIVWIFVIVVDIVAASNPS